MNTSALATTLVKDRVESENIYRGDYYSGKTNVERSPRHRRPFCTQQVLRLSSQPESIHTWGKQSDAKWENSAKFFKQQKVYLKKKR